MKKANSFSYKNVELKNSHWERQRQICIETYLQIPNDELLYYFRDLAELPQVTEHGLCGWYGHGASTFGQKLGAFTKLYLVTNDYRLKEKAIYLADEWGKCLEKSSRIADVNDTYCYEKLLGGFLDMYEFLGYEPSIVYIQRLTKSVFDRFPRDIKRDGLQDYDLSSRRMIEWYTLPENLYRAYKLTGDTLYYSFAEEWEYQYLWDRLREGKKEIGPRHAYSQVNSLSSAARAYEVKEDLYYLDVMEKAYSEIVTNHVFATGGYGPAECLFTEYDGYMGDSIKETWDSTRIKKEYRNFGDSMVQRNDSWGSCEVSCCAWAVFKLCNYLL